MMQQRFHHHVTITCLLLAVMVLVCLFSALPVTAAEPTATTATEANYPVTGRMVVTPVTDKEMEVHFTINIARIWDGPWSLIGDATSDTLADSKAWITVLWAGINGKYSEARKYTEIPPEDIVVSGDTSWSGNIQEPMTIELKSTVRLPKDGKWAFIGQFAGKNWTRPVKRSLYMAVADGFAIPYYSQDLVESPLDYLECFDYGQNGKLPPDEQRPVYLELDMDHPPLAGEEVAITYVVTSPFYDVEGYEAKTRIRKRTEGNEVIEVPAVQIVVESEIGWDVNAYGDTIWKGWETDISKDETRESIHIIKFPETGDWEIYIHGKCRIEGMGVCETNDTIRLTITEDKAYYGWANIPPETTTTIPSLIPPPTDVTVGPTPPPSSGAIWWWIGGGVLVVAGILAIVFWKRRNT